jgi:hypothetical protein
LALILGLADLWYWGVPFYSLRHIIEYTVLRRLSSRGLQPWYEYARVTPWSDVVTVSLALYAAWLREWRIALWTWAPIVVLSALPHKEPRYLMPMLPFLSMSAAIGLWRLIEKLRAVDHQALPRLAAALLLACAAAVAIEASSFNFVRTDPDVRLAEALAGDPATTGAAVEQLWRVGGHLYFPPGVVLVDFDRDRLSEAAFLPSVLSNASVRWIALISPEPSLVRAIVDAGFVPNATPAAAAKSHYHVYERAFQAPALR